MYGDDTDVAKSHALESHDHRVFALSHRWTHSEQHRINTVRERNLAAKIARLEQQEVKNNNDNDDDGKIVDDA